MAALWVITFVAVDCRNLLELVALGLGEPPTIGDLGVRERTLPRRAAGELKLPKLAQPRQGGELGKLRTLYESSQCLLQRLMQPL